MSASSYGDGVKTSGTVRIVLDLGMESLEDYDVLLVEDILDTGTAISVIKEKLLQRKPASLRVCTLLDKPANRIKNVNADYFCFTVPDEFIVGYGLDYREKYRNLPYIGVLNPTVYNAE